MNIFVCVGDTLGDSVALGGSVASGSFVDGSVVTGIALAPGVFVGGEPPQLIRRLKQASINSAVISLVSPD